MWLLRSERLLQTVVVVVRGRMRPGFSSGLLSINNNNQAHVAAATLDGVVVGNEDYCEASAAVDAEEEDGDDDIVVTSKGHNSRPPPPEVQLTLDSERIDVEGGLCGSLKEQSCESGMEEFPVHQKNPEFPIPLSPFGGESAKQIEYARAMVAEAAMKAGPAISRQDVLFEDEWLLVVNKPRGLYSEHVFESVLSNPIPSDTANNSQHHLHLANRLDRDTSGVMVITKCKEAAAKLTRAFTDRKVHKTYLAMCAASQPSWNQVRIESGHGRSRYGAWRVYSKSDVGRILPGGSMVRDMITQLELIKLPKLYEQKQQSQALLTTPAADSAMLIVATSEVDVLLRSEEKRCSPPEEDETVTVLRAFPETGRTHQIRLHCQYLGLPLCGDVKYGGPQTWKGINYDSHVLHAESIAFSHPITLETLRICAPCPCWAADLGICPFFPQTII